MLSIFWALKPAFLCGPVWLRASNFLAFRRDTSEARLVNRWSCAERAQPPGTLAT